MNEIKNIIDKHKNIEKLEPLFNLIDAFDMVLYEYDDIEEVKEYFYNTIYENTVTIRNLLLETEGDNKEIIDVLNKIIYVFIELNY